MTIPWDWIILIAVLLFLTYAAIAIREEKNAYKDSARDFTFGPFILALPSWWALKKEEKNKVTFHRSDTRYDWQASFEWFERKNPQDAKKTLIDRFENLDLLFDEDKVETTQAEYLFKNSDIVSAAKEFYRIEGMASQDTTKRVYIDIIIYKPSQTNGYLIAESISSVLNGCVEGPYFEEVLKNLEFQKSSTVCKRSS